MRPITRIRLRERRHLRLRQKVHGTAERPRMSVCFTGRHIYVQFIDDALGRTLVSVSTIAPEAKGTRANLGGAKKIGTLAAQKAKEKNISEIVFDRGGFRYHGRVKALADAAREAGLKF
ncbi:MAG: 50S ribosomal protein L18 [Verrucomicrobiia bacterium]